MFVYEFEQRKKMLESSSNRVYLRCANRTNHFYSSRSRENASYCARNRVRRTPSGYLDRLWHIPIYPVWGMSIRVRHIPGVLRGRCVTWTFETSKDRSVSHFARIVPLSVPWSDTLTFPGRGRVQQPTSRARAQAPPPAPALTSQ
jgi:hypothetical protein